MLTAVVARAGTGPKDSNDQCEAMPSDLRS